MSAFKFQLAPMGMGEMIDRSAGFWRSRVGTLFRLYLGFQIVQYAVTKLYVFAISKWFPLMLGGAKAMATIEKAPEEALRQMSFGWTVGLGVMLIYVLISWFAGVGVSRYVMPSLMGKPATLGEAMQHTMRRAGAIVVAFMLSLLWSVAVGVLLMVPGAAMVGLGIALVSTSKAAAVLVGLGALVMLFGLLAAMLWYVLRFFLTATVLGLEEVGPVEAIRRSGELLSGRIGAGVSNLVKVRATILITVLALILTAVGVLSGLPALIIRGIYGNAFDPMNATPEAIPQALLIPAELLQVVATAAVGPLFLVLGVLFYLDMRSRREGLDLELRLEARGAPTP